VSATGGRMKVIMICHGVEISIAGGVAQTEDDLSHHICFFFPFVKSNVHCSYGTRHDMHLMYMAKAKPKIK